MQSKIPLLATVFVCLFCVWLFLHFFTKIVFLVGLVAIAITVGWFLYHLSSTGRKNSPDE